MSRVERRRALVNLLRIGRRRCCRRNHGRYWMVAGQCFSVLTTQRLLVVIGANMSEQVT